MILSSRQCRFPTKGRSLRPSAEPWSAVDYNAFKLESYQVNINGSTATVDMQLAPSSQRQFVSLSSCEQRALFGSVEKTLLNNADWNVSAVKFTSNGKKSCFSAFFIAIFSLLKLTA